MTICQRPLVGRRNKELSDTDNWTVFQCIDWLPFLFSIGINCTRMSMNEWVEYNSNDKKNYACRASNFSSALVFVLYSLIIYTSKRFISIQIYKENYDYGFSTILNRTIRNILQFSVLKTYTARHRFIYTLYKCMHSHYLYFGKGTKFHLSLYSNNVMEKIPILNPQAET